MPASPDPSPFARDRCPKCGSHLSPGTLPEACPTCLLESALQEPPQGQHGKEPSPALLDELFPEYDVLELVGRGGMGAVYRANNRKLNRPVALKVLVRGQFDPAFYLRFEREARTLASLQHPCIVGIQDFGEVAGLPFLAMDFVGGPTLRSLVQPGGLPWRRAVALLRQLARALDHAHRRGVVHRDIKPENLLLTAEGDLQVADFGLGRLCDEPDALTALTVTGSVMGTPIYMAPEQLEGSDALAPCADVYAAGVVLYELLTGRLPLGRFHFPVSVPPGLVELASRALEQDPDKRFADGGELLAALDRIDEDPALPGENGPSEAPRRRAHDRSSATQDWLQGERRKHLKLAASLMLASVLFAWGSVHEYGQRISLQAWNSSLFGISFVIHALVGALVFMGLRGWVTRRVVYGVVIAATLHVTLSAVVLIGSRKSELGFGLLVAAAGYLLAHKALHVPSARKSLPKKGPSTRTTSALRQSRARRRQRRRANQATRQRES